MKLDIGTRSTGRLRKMLHDILQPGQTTAVTGQSIGELTRRGLAVVLSALMIMIPMWQGEAFAQSVPKPVPYNQLHQLRIPVSKCRRGNPCLLSSWISW